MRSVPGAVATGSRSTTIEFAWHKTPVATARGTDLIAIAQFPILKLFPA